MQPAMVIVIVGACAVWLGVLAWRFVRPKAGGKGCAGGCCDGPEKPAVGKGAGGTRTMMVMSDDLRARLKARQS